MSFLLNKLKKRKNVDIVCADLRNRQMWWETTSVPPHSRNRFFRKDKFKRFWTMLLHRGAWSDERYLAAKSDAMRLDGRRTSYEWHRRDIMPKCVLSLMQNVLTVVNAKSRLYYSQILFLNVMCNFFTDDKDFPQRIFTYTFIISEEIEGLLLNIQLFSFYN
ncbi:hypothetical protein KUTeg_000026 [Tegillarca granosa]|uniref:Uncharacterized protein n=1 Tax=Tegillarca granosa TaxID=220873 RepID=A0ABQ9FYU6_TEGGR|nr:hypothetical protein KUTeg_000026 [Tegillarca granosa]